MAAVDDSITAVITSPTSTGVLRPNARDTQPAPGATRTAGRSEGCKLSASPPPLLESRQSEEHKGKAGEHGPRGSLCVRRPAV